MSVIEILNRACILFNCLFLFWFRAKFAIPVNHVFHFLMYFMPSTIETVEMKNLEYQMKLMGVSSSSRFKSYAKSDITRAEDHFDRLDDH